LLGEGMLIRIKEASNGCDLNPSGYAGCGKRLKREGCAILLVFISFLA
jgi:hypothetical protein